MRPPVCLSASFVSTLSDHRVSAMTPRRLHQQQEPSRQGSTHGLPFGRGELRFSLQKFGRIGGGAFNSSGYDTSSERFPVCRFAVCDRAHRACDNLLSRRVEAGVRIRE